MQLQAARGHRLPLRQLPKADGLKADPPREPPTPPPAKEALIDTLKRRSSLINLSDEVGQTLALVGQPAKTLAGLSGAATALWHGDTHGCSQHIEGLVGQAVNPVAPFSYVYRGGQWLSAGVNTTIGGLEVSQGLRAKNPYMAAMGLVDMVAGASSGVVAAGFAEVSLGLTVASALARIGLVMAQPQSFSRVQKMKTCFDTGFAISSAMLRAQIAVVPNLGIQSALGLGEVLYMNVPGFQKRTDLVTDWVRDFIQEFRTKPRDP